jgi:hypothetical protein
LDDVLKFPARARPLADADALARLREAGVTKAASVAELGRSFDWKREPASKALERATCREADVADAVKFT